jgi:hypothetical protein
MDLLIRYNDGPGMGSPAGGVTYFGGHLQETKEGGGLAMCPGYLSRDGLVKPEIHNPDLWREVGWDPSKHELPPPDLLRELSLGYDLQGNKLTQSRALFRQPKEALITLPAEVSQSLKDHPEIARDILREVVAAHLAEVEREAVRVRVGGRVQEWRPAQTLSLAYFHAENRGGEVHFHAHTMTFAPAKGEDGTWRSWDNGRNVQRLSKPGGGREKATDAMLAAATKHGLEVDLRRGKASLAPGMAQGATVKGPDGTVIEAGSLDRARRVEILAAQELKRELGGVVPLTPRELEFIRKEMGKLPQSLPGERRRLAVASKLNELGMLGEDGRILPKAELAEKLKGYERKLAQAQVQLEAGATLPGTGEKHLEAARLIQGRREHVAAVVGAVPGGGVDLAASTKAARIRWTEDYSRVLLLAHQAGPEGLRTDALNKRDRDLLSKLKGAGHLTGEKEHGRLVYRTSSVGVSKLQELRAERGPLVDSLLPRVREELQLAAGAHPGPAGRGGEGPGRTAEAAALPPGTDVHRGPWAGEGAAGIQREAPGLGNRAA